MRRYPAPRPRNVTVTREEIETLLSRARPHIKLWLLLCSDLAIRSGTASQLSPHHYDKHAGTLTFTTKCDEHLTLPVTAEVRQLLETCDLTNPTPFVRQIWQTEKHKPGPRPASRNADSSALAHAFRKLCAECGIKRYIRPHDLRRTTAVAMLEATGDPREAQSLLGHKSLSSTIWYLDHDLRPIKRHTLEMLKRPNAKEERTA